MDGIRSKRTKGATHEPDEIATGNRAAGRLVLGHAPQRWPGSGAAGDLHLCEEARDTDEPGENDIYEMVWWSSNRTKSTSI
jgi:hypothetical protein